MTEDELLRMLGGDDHAALQVCADWLEGNGQIDAAMLLRLEHRLRTQTRPRDLLALGAEASALAAKTPAPWLASLAPRSPIGQWRGPDNDRTVWKFHYLVGGALHYSNDSTTHEDGVWKQLGSLLVMSTNNKFTSYVGLLVDGRIVGAARTIHDLQWTWEVTPVGSKQRPKLRGRLPDKARRKEIERATAKPKRAAKPKPASPGKSKPKRAPSTNPKRAAAKPRVTKKPAKRASVKKRSSR